MIIQDREIVLKEDFVYELGLISDYLQNFNPLKAERFLKNVFDFIEFKIALFPLAFPEYEGKLTPDKIYRRAVFQKNYAIIYKVLSDSLELLVIYHVSRDPTSIDI